MSSLLHPLRHKRFRVVWIGQAVNVAGDAAFGVVIALHLLSRPDAEHALGAVLGLAALGGVVSLLWGGVLADRYRRTRVVAAADLVRATALVVVVLAGPDGPLAVLAGGALVLGVGTGVYRPAYSALLPSLVPAEDVRAANALRSATNRVAAIVGAGAGGALAAATSTRTALWIDAATFLLSIVTVIAVREAPRPRADAEESVVKAARDGIAYVMGRPWITAVLLQGLAQLSLVVAPVTILLPLLLGADGGVYGVVVALEAAGAVLGAAVAARVDTAKPGLAASVALLAQLPQTVTLAVSANPVALAAAGFLAGLGLSVFGVLWTTALQTQTPPDLLGRVLSLDALANSALTPAAIVAVGWLAPTVGTTALAWIATAALVVSILAILPVPGVATFAEPGASRALEGSAG